MDDRGKEAAGRLMQEREDELTRCPECNSDFVFPEQWEELGKEAYVLWLRCPECEWSTTGVFALDAVERFDDELDRGQVELVRALKRIERSNMIDEIDQLSRALAADAVQPMDF